MSRRTSKAIKAIREAWEKERELILQGKGTRNWTKEQQLDIFDSNIGKAYDTKGFVYQGHHMKSVEEYPEYQGNYLNIQFLTRKEHFEAHQGNWHKPTNWYYNPETKEFLDFGEKELIPCEVIKLSQPLFNTNIKAHKISDEQKYINTMQYLNKFYEEYEENENTEEPPTPHRGMHR